LKKYSPALRPASDKLVVDRTPSNLSSGIVHWTLKRTPDGYRVYRKDVVLDSIESAEFQSIDFVSERQDRW